jgi:beta-N-acetylhexosaminidase
LSAVGEQTTLAERKRRAGQRLLIGLHGYAVSADLRRLVAELRPAGFVLFARNVAEPAQVRELNRELASLVDPAAPALLAVDQEGGRVQRVREPATRWPPMRAVGRAHDHTAAVATALGRELHAMGFNLNFAPVADVDSNPENPIIGDRAFDSDPDRVAAHVAAFVRAQQEAGVIACAKHFPGHGDTRTDSHLELPVVERPEPELRRVELPPFRAAVEAGVGTVMTAHVVFEAIDPGVPATLSSVIVPRWLRGELGFEGVVFSDDLEMKAVRGRYDADEQVLRATEASVDVLLCCDRVDVQVEVFEALVRAQEARPDQDRLARDAVNRVRALRERFLLGRPPAPDLSIVGCDAHRDLVHRVLADENRALAGAGR